MNKTELLILAPFVMALWWCVFERTQGTRWRNMFGPAVVMAGLSGFICFIVWICTQ